MNFLTLGATEAQGSETGPVTPAQCLRRPWFIPVCWNLTCFPLSLFLGEGSRGYHFSQWTAFSFFFKRRGDKGLRKPCFLRGNEGEGCIPWLFIERPLCARHRASRTKQRQLPKTGIGPLSTSGRPRGVTALSQERSPAGRSRNPRPQSPASCLAGARGTHPPEERLAAEGSSRRAPSVATATKAVLTSDPAAPPSPAPLHSRKQNGEGQPGSVAAGAAAAAAATCTVLGAQNPDRPSPVPAALQPGACRRRGGCVAPCPRSHSAPRRPAPARRRSWGEWEVEGEVSERERGRASRWRFVLPGSGGVAGPGWRASAGRAGGSEEARAAWIRGGREAGGCELGGRALACRAGGRPPTSQRSAGPGRPGLTFPQARRRLLVPGAGGAWRCGRGGQDGAAWWWWVPVLLKKGDPQSSRVPGLPPWGPWTSALGKLGCCEIARLR